VKKGGGQGRAKSTAKDSVQGKTSRECFLGKKKKPKKAGGTSADREGLGKGGGGKRKPLRRGHAKNSSGGKKKSKRKAKRKEQKIGCTKGCEKKLVKKLERS